MGVGGLGLTYLLPAETDGPPLWVGGWGLAGWGSPTCYQRRLMDLHCGWVGVGGLALTYLLPAETDGPPLWVGGGWRVGAPVSSYYRATCQMTALNLLLGLCAGGRGSPHHSTTPSLTTRLVNDS